MSINQMITMHAAIGERDDEITHLRATLAERDAEIAALKAEREWRLIESAPRDGTRVLVYAPPPDPAKWHGSTLGSLICSVEYHEVGVWCVCETREATHWQPLPPAPPMEPTNAG